MTTGLYVGAITGTSVDGLDLALLFIQAPQGAQAETIAFHHAETVPLPEALRRTLIDLGQGHDDHLDALGHADTELGRFIGTAVLEFLAPRGVDPKDINAIGSHGQTVRHRPDDAMPFTLQIGDPGSIAEASGIATIADFRRADMAAGGQAAPLVPPFHDVLFRHPDEPRVVANIGGISNITVLHATEPVSGFDTGPGNALMDAWCQQHQGSGYDEEGRWAASGEVIQTLLSRLLVDPYLGEAPPKSTGKERYNLGWLTPQLDDSISAADVQRTLTAFTAQSLADAVSRWAPDTARMLVCGGGRLNPVLMDDLNAALPCPVEAVERVGVDGDAVEAAAFAWLAYKRLRGEPANAPAVTGARGPRVLGGLYQPFG